MRIVHKPKVFECKSCKKGYFNEVEALKDHVIKTHANMFYQAVQNGLVNVENPSKPVTNQLFDCMECDERFLGKDALTDHMIKEHRSQVFRCNQCTSFFYKEEHLKAHKISFHKKFYSCKFCKFSSDSYEDAKAHSSTCFPKNFYFSCNFCDFKATTAVDRDNHIEEVHNNRQTIGSLDSVHRVQCKLCGVNTTTKESMESHMRDFHGTATEPTDKIECKFCDLHFYSKDTYEKHVQVKHYKELLQKKRKPGRYSC